MKNIFSISETAKIVGMTSETLRHYDRIGLVRPSKKDEWTGYRYYSPQEIIRLNTIQALRIMDLSLKEIKEILEYDNLEKIIQCLEQAEKSADEKIMNLQKAKLKIGRAKNDYIKKRNRNQHTGEMFLQQLPKRVILLSDTLHQPTIDNLWLYHNHFYEMIDPSKKEAFVFEDLAGVYEENGKSALFVSCIRYENREGLKSLPEGNYLCGECSEEDRLTTCEKLMKAAREQYGAEPGFTVQLVVISGILQWDYQIQVYLDSMPHRCHMDRL